MQSKKWNWLVFAICWMGISALPALAGTAITSVTANTSSVAKYEKLELSIVVSDSFKNPYDPDEADLSAQFTSPSKKIWKVNGFHDGDGWKIRFAANEVGSWQYLVTMKDSTGASISPSQTFTCTDSKHHGWVRIAPNRRYLMYDDGTSFYGEGCCYAWQVTDANLDQMRAIGFNTYVYWNGTYDSEGGKNLIESMESGIGRYDQPKCQRIDQLIEWNESRDMTMILVILPHDYGCQNVGGTWPAKWSLNPYSTIVSSNDYYSDPKSWDYQQKQYRYIIARWGYSRGLNAWQTVDEISGTNGWKANKNTANVWAAKIGDYFQTNDPFHHPTTASHGNFWDEGNKANDLPNTEVYGNYATGNIIKTIQKLWNGYEKPCIMGETGAERNGPSAHRKIWAGLAAGVAVTPLLWQYNQGWAKTISQQYPAFNAFIADIDFATLQSPSQAKLSIPGMPLPTTQPATTSDRGNPAAGAAPGAAAPSTRTGRRGRGERPLGPDDVGAWGITSDQLTFGWITGQFAGKNLHATEMKNGRYKIEWWDCATGNPISTATVTVTDETLDTPIPPTTQPDLAFKIFGPSGN